MGIKENIKILRSKYGLSQKELAKIAGVSDKAVSTWETGEKEPRMGSIQKMADHFGIKKSNIIEDGGMDDTAYYVDPEIAALAEEFRTNPDIRILFNASKDLSKEDMKFVLDMVNRLKEKEHE